MMPGRFPRWIYLSVFFISHLTYADPWFTGSILSHPAAGVPKGHVSIAPFLYDLHTIGFYNTQGNIEDVPAFRTVNVIPFITVGVTDKLNLKIAPQYFINSSLGKHYDRLGDTVISAGYQLFKRPVKYSWIPNISIIGQEIIPTGKFDRFNASNNAIESTGLGAYQTVFIFSCESLVELVDGHYLRTQFNFGAYSLSKIDVRGVNGFGGSDSTFGTVHPGGQYNALGTMEFTINQNWVTALDVSFFHAGRVGFNGFLGKNAENEVATVGTGKSYALSIAPELEYNFTQNFGLIGGVWFSVKGVNASQFIGAVAGITYLI